MCLIFVSVFLFLPILSSFPFILVKVFSSLRLLLHLIFKFKVLLSLQNCSKSLSGLILLNLHWLFPVSYKHIEIIPSLDIPLK